jgi:site-specific recombinase XerD
MMVINFLQSNSIGTSLVSLVKGFILSQRSDCRSPDTIAFYDGCLKRFLWWVEQNKVSDDARLLTEWQVREFLAYVSGETHRWGKEGNGANSSKPRATYNTVHHYYRVLRAFFNWCIKENFLTESPVVKIKMANPKLGVIQPYSNDEIIKILSVCELDFKNNAKLLGSRNKAIILVMFDSGLRLSELANIKIDDIDTDRGWIKVKGKGDKERIVRIGSTAQKALWRYLIFRQKNKYQALWLTEEGKPFTKDGVQTMVKRIKERAGVSAKGNCHRFRHTFALNFLRNDRNPFNLQYLLGHSDLRMTRHYVSTLGAEDALKAHESASPADCLGLK